MGANFSSNLTYINQHVSSTLNSSCPKANACQNNMAADTLDLDLTNCDVEFINACAQDSQCTISIMKSALLSAYNSLTESQQETVFNYNTSLNYNSIDEAIDDMINTTCSGNNAENNMHIGKLVLDCKGSKLQFTNTSEQRSQCVMNNVVQYVEGYTQWLQEQQGSNFGLIVAGIVAVLLLLPLGMWVYRKFAGNGNKKK